MQAQKFEFSPSVGYHPDQEKLGPTVFPLITDHILEKSVIALTQILPKFFPAAYIFSNTIMTNLKKLTGTKFLNTK